MGTIPKGRFAIENLANIGVKPNCILAASNDNILLNQLLYNNLIDVCH